MIKIAKIFQNGRSQAVRLPKAFRFDTEEVYVRKSGDDIILSPKHPSWDSFFDDPDCATEDFMETRDQGMSQIRETF